MYAAVAHQFYSNALRLHLPLTSRLQGGAVYIDDGGSLATNSEVNYIDNSAVREALIILGITCASYCGLRCDVSASTSEQPLRNSRRGFV